MSKQDLFPKEIIEFNEECTKPEHRGLWIRLTARYGEEWANADQFEKMVMMCTEIQIALDSTYTMVELAERLTYHMREERMRQSTLHIH